MVKLKIKCDTNDVFDKSNIIVQFNNNINFWD